MQIQSVGIIGGGTMGTGLAIVTAKTNLQAILIEKSQHLADVALEHIKNEIDVQIRRWAMTESEKKLVMANVHIKTAIQEVSDADIVISAVPDDLDLKKHIFSQLNSVCKSDTIFASISGVLSITEMATSLEHPEKMLGLHFKNPVLKTRLVEIVRGFKTSDETYETGKAFVRGLGKQGIEVFEAPGLVSTRIIVPLLNEAMYALLEGVASAEDIDTAMKLGFNMQTGPLEIADRIGLDTLLNVMNHLFRETGEREFRPCPLIRKMVRANHLGVKTGEGFFTYDSETGKKLPLMFS